MNPIRKRNIKASAELKTMADYALILEYIKGYSKSESSKMAMVSESEPIFKELLKRNLELFTTGDIIIH